MKKNQMASIVRGMTKPTQPPSRTADQFVVRFPDGMRDRIAEEAKKNNRSMNAEIVARLERSLEEPIFGDGTQMRTFEDVERRLQNLARQMDLKLRLVKATPRPRRSGPEDEPPGTTKRTIPKK